MSYQPKPCPVCGDPMPTGRHATCGDAACRKTRQQQYIDEYVARRRAARREGAGPLIRCEVCGQEQEVISYLHLAKHGLTVAEYRALYPEAPMACNAVRTKRGTSMDGRRKYLKYDGREPDRRLLSFLAGAMLGDGSLEASNVHARYAEGGANEPYQRFKHALLKDYFPTTFRERLSKTDRRTGKRYRAWWVRTVVHPLLTEWRKAWYAGGKKVLPLKLVEEHLDEFALAIWYFDDGHLGTSCRNACLYTMDLTPDESAALADLLVRRFGIESRVRVNAKGQPYLYLGPAGRQRLLEVVRPHLAPGMAYKVGLTEAEVLPVQHRNAA